MFIVNADPDNRFKQMGTALKYSRLYIFLAFESIK